jgi:hypothetical protein
MIRIKGMKLEKEKKIPRKQDEQRSERETKQIGDKKIIMRVGEFSPI